MLVPRTGLTTLKKEMDRLFDRFWEWDFPEIPALLGEWSPRLDLSETGEAFVVKAEIPGIDPKEVEVSLQGELLTIKGEKRQEKEEKGEHFHRVERSYGAFARSFRLPAPVDAGKVTATFKNGLLTVKLPKAPGARGTTIPVKAE
jgi:HSP20 family protein